MQRTITMALGAILATLSLFTATAEAAETYAFYDLSPAIPHKSGKTFDGIWQDGKSWLASNGNDLIAVDGDSFKVTNRTPDIQKFGMYMVEGAAGADGKWLIAGQADGGNLMAYGSKDYLFVEMTDAGVARVMPNITLNPNTNFNLFSAGGKIFMLIHSRDDSWKYQAKLYGYDAGSFTEMAVPDWVSKYVDYPYFSATQDGGKLLISSIYGGGNNNEWAVFDGQDWTKSVSEGSMTALDDQIFVLAHGQLSRQGMRYASYVHRIYGIVNGRDSLDIASRRPDGVALLGGFGANGLRLVLASPSYSTAVKDGSGTVVLDVARVPGSASKYVLTAKATAPANYVRILKNGIGIAKCLSQTCKVTVDVKGTADRFEAWAQPKDGADRQLTSKATILRDTDALQQTKNWNGDYGTGISWAWLQPSSFFHQMSERVSWHVGANQTATLKYTCTYLQGEPGYDCTYSTGASEIESLIDDLKSLKAEVFVEGKSRQVCTVSAETIEKIRQEMDKDGYRKQVSIDDCSASFTLNDGPKRVAQKTSYGGYKHTAQVPEGYVRVYAKISWQEQDKKTMTVSPTDMVWFQTEQ